MHHGASTLQHVWVSCRPPQWIKNGLVFLPVLFAERLFDITAWFRVAMMFAVFCLAASGSYLWNDVVDRAQDRVHPLKRRRPIAAGNLEPQTALRWALACLAVALLSAYTIHPWFGTVILLYLAGNALYTWRLRHVVIVDVFCIAFFFVLRVVSVPAVLQIPFSFWLIILTALLALFLALNKRRYELTRLAKRAQAHRAVLHSYSPYFIDQMCAAITAAIIIGYILYTLDLREVRKFGSHNLTFSIPLVCYGVFRYQYLVFKRRQGGDPARIVLSDRVLLMTVLLWLIVCGLAIYSHREWVPFPLS